MIVQAIGGVALAGYVALIVYMIWSVSRKYKE
jgi:hypothetical protein